MKTIKQTDILKNKIANLKGSFSDFIASVEDQYADSTSNAEEVLEEGKSRLEQMSNDLSR